MAYTPLVQIAWDQAKNLANQQKHGLSFERACELFRPGVRYLEIFDEEHSFTEDRFIAIGPIRRGLVVVIWTDRDDDTIRIIGAPWATKHEQTLYRNHVGETL